jgi:hypothetical protein
VRGRGSLGGSQGLGGSLAATGEGEVHLWPG